MISIYTNILKKKLFFAESIISIGTFGRRFFSSRKIQTGSTRKKNQSLEFRRFSLMNFHGKYLLNLMNSDGPLWFQPNSSSISSRQLPATPGPSERGFWVRSWRGVWWWSGRAFSSSSSSHSLDLSLGSLSLSRFSFIFFLKNYKWERLWLSVNAATRL